MLIQTMQELCALPGISGREQPVQDAIRAALKKSPVPMTVTQDALGNLFVALTGRQRAKQRVVIAAHMDEVGLIVTGVTAEGFLRFATVGGIRDEVLFGRLVSVNGHPGVIGGKAVHQCSAAEKKAVPKAKTMLIDIGADTREQALAVANPGDSVTFPDTVVPLENGRFCAKAIDDRGGVAVLLALAQEQPAYDFTLAFTVQEEVGLRGAKTAGMALQPDYAVIVDATTAADTVGVPADREVCRQGHGGVVSFMDNATVYDKDLFDFIIKEAAAAHIPVQVKEAVAGGNDAGAFQTAGAGTRVAAVSLPCRYIHSPGSVLDGADTRSLLQLLQRLCAVLPEGLA